MFTETTRDRREPWLPLLLDVFDPLLLVTLMDDVLAPDAQGPPTDETDMHTVFSDMARERFAAELEAADVDHLRGLAYSYLGLATLSAPSSMRIWQWKVDMIRDECERRGLHDLVENERVAVEHERAGTVGEPLL
jgi:hypothetical protein